MQKIFYQRLLLTNSNQSIKLIKFFKFKQIDFTYQSFFPLSFLSHISSRTTIDRQCLIPITVKPKNRKSQTVANEHKHQHCPVHRHDQHHRGDMQDRVQTVIQKVKDILLPWKHLVITLLSCSQEKQFESLAVGRKRDGKVGNDGWKNCPTYEWELVVDCPSEFIDNDTFRT